MECIVHGVAKSRRRLSDFDFHINQIIISTLRRYAYTLMYIHTHIHVSSHIEICKGTFGIPRENSEAQVESAVPAPAPGPAAQPPAARAPLQLPARTFPLWFVGGCCGFTRGPAAAGSRR